MAESREVVYDSGELFRVEEVAITGREKPYAFVRRIGAVTVLPIIRNETAEPSVLAIHNNRAYYGASLGLPGGNADGGFEEPEEPYVTAMRELREETGFASADGSAGVDVFLMRPVSSTILYPRYFAVARNVEYVGGEVHDPHEQITPAKLPISEYMQPVFALDRGDLYPEVNLALAKAAREHGETAIIDWIVDGADDTRVPDSFATWMTPVGFESK